MGYGPIAESASLECLPQKQCSWSSCQAAVLSAALVERSIGTLVDAKARSMCQMPMSKLAGVCSALGSAKAQSMWFRSGKSLQAIKCNFSCTHLKAE